MRLFSRRVAMVGTLTDNREVDDVEMARPALKRLLPVALAWWLWSWGPTAVDKVASLSSPWLGEYRGPLFKYAFNVWNAIR